MLLLRCTHRQSGRASADALGLHTTKKIADTLSSPSSPKKGTPPAEHCEANETDRGVSPATLWVDNTAVQGPHCVPLAVMILRGNYLTDAGALALCPLVEASATLKEIDLRGNFIDNTARAALKKVGLMLEEKRFLPSANGSSIRWYVNVAVHGVTSGAPLVSYCFLVE